MSKPESQTTIVKIKLALCRLIRAPEENTLQKTCNHTDASVLFELAGASVGWDGKMTRVFNFHYTCKACGKRWSESGMIFPNDRKHHPECYATDGYPIEPVSGRRLEVC